jgi:cell division protein FtsW
LLLSCCAGLTRAGGLQDDFTRLAVAGLALLIGFQSFINIGVNLELLPAKGMTLPLVSYGGSSMIAVAITAGFLLALTRRRPESRAQPRPFYRVAESVAAE